MRLAVLPFLYIYLRAAPKWCREKWRKFKKSWWATPANSSAQRTISCVLKRLALCCGGHTDGGPGI